VQPPAPSPETIAAWKKFCESAGLTWDPVNNKCLQSTPPAVLTPGAMACQAAGGTWNAATNQCMGLPPPPAAPPPPPQQKKESGIDLRALAVLIGAVIVGAYVYKEYGSAKPRKLATRNPPPKMSIAERRQEFERRKAFEASLRAARLEESRARVRRHLEHGEVTMAEHAAELGLTPAEYRAIERSHRR
jgi:hypothetical protein